MRASTTGRISAVSIEQLMAHSVPYPASKTACTPALRKIAMGIHLAHQSLVSSLMPQNSEQRILITQANDGMVLARTVILPNKVALCARGTVLSEALITRLMIRGIKRIYIQGRDLPGPHRDGFNQSIQQLHERFSRCRQFPTMASLENIVERVMVKHL
jgi:hypothetical protein